ncbi:MAG TPA: DUF4159 domain-containing protein [Stellaceae bacterium]|nr:DUF4159 domain-containing protein [Stellaceae bacterium]
MLSFGSFAFASPWLLAGFVVLPVLWWLLRVTPPPATVVRFPAVRLLFGLNPPERTPARTPLWLILLRMLLASLLILALARPLARPSAAIGGSGPLLLVIDDGWAAAPAWPDHLRLLNDLIGRADREGRQVVVATDAAGAAKTAPEPMRAADARALVQSLAPKPWPTDRAALLKRLDGTSFQSASAYWLTDGLGGDGAVELARRLVRFGPTRIVLPGSGGTARLLAPGPAEATDLTVAVRRAENGAARPISLRAMAADGRLLGEADGSFADGATQAQIAFKMPAELRNRVDRIDLAGEAGAGGALLLDESARRRPVGIAGDRPEGSQQPLLSDRYYLERALEPFVELRRAPISALVENGVGMIVVPDGAAAAPTDRDTLKSWIERGGVAVRFAGPALAASRDDDLLPVALRRGDRTIGGAMSWEKPAHLADFPAESPLHGLAAPEDVTVDRQVLAEPSPDLPGRTWATLTDGTPLVTAERRGKGWLVLIHTSASPTWSNLSISGLFVGMLRRFERLGRGQAWNDDTVLKPWQVMDGLGRLGAPPASAQPIRAREIGTAPASPEHPPGFYGTEDSHAALNLGTGIASLTPFPALPLGAMPESYDRPVEVEFRPTLLSAAFLLLLIDIVIGYALRGLVPVRRAAGTAAVLLAVLALAPAVARADAPASSTSDSFVIEATKQLRLAYVKTGDSQADQVSRDGLAGLGNILARRTSVETGEPMAVDVEHDELIFFPLIYWPLTETEPPLSPAAAARVNRYLETGGTILFDTRDQGTAPQNGASDTANRLNTLLAGVHVPPLVQVPPDHVLTKSFYLMQDFPGRWIGGPLWVEPAEDRVNDGVSTIVVGSNDWASAWAMDQQGMPMYPVVPGGEQQREMAYRFGVNLVMYALTGNYKADQVHVPAILERLGQ